MAHSPLRVALTGGIATGKSRCLSRFETLGAPAIDADEVARMVVEPGTPGYAAVVARFGHAIVGPDGAIDRPALGSLVFADAAARRDLERIVHPAVYTVIERWFDELARWSGARVAIADVPLLYETGHQGDFDRVIVAACAPETQLARLMARDGLAEADARRRIAAQRPIGDKVRLADHVIDTSGTVASTDQQVLEVWAAITGSPVDPSPPPTCS